MVGSDMCCRTISKPGRLYDAYIYFSLPSLAELKRVYDPDGVRMRMTMMRTG